MSGEPLPSRPVFPRRPIPAKATLRRPISLPQYLPARMVNEYVYCPRLFFYEWVEGVFAHSGDTVEGALRHGTLGEKAEGLPPADAAGDDRIHSRSVSLSSEHYGLTAVIDLVEGESGRVSPVDYKHGAPREREGLLEAWPQTACRSACKRSSCASRATRATKRSFTTTRPNSACASRRRL